MSDEIYFKGLQSIKTLNKLFGKSFYAISDL